MDFYKQFLYNLRSVVYGKLSIVINDDISSKVKQYVKLLLNTKCREETYHTYYGEIKCIVTSFNSYWTCVINADISTVDKYNYFISKDELLDILEKTINIRYVTQADFGKQFLPMDTKLEKQCYDIIQAMFEANIEDLYKAIDEVKSLDKQDKVQEFAKNLLSDSLMLKYKMFDCTNNTIALYLADNCKKIQISLEENLKRVLNNLDLAEKEQTAEMSRLRNKLYESNKELIILGRAVQKCPVSIAEAQETVELLKKQMNKTINAPINKNLQEECVHWRNIVKEFGPIMESLEKLKILEDKLLQRRNFHQSLNKVSSGACWATVNKKINQKFEEFHNLKMTASKSMLSFFSIKGTDKIFYTDNIGKYFVDPYGHQVYHFDNGLNLLHVNCEEKFVKVLDEHKYYYDKYGRYLLKNNKKLYQVAPCCSTFKLENGVFKSDPVADRELEIECNMELKDPNDKVLLHEVAPIDLKGKLNKDTSEYLWKNLAAVLSQALLDVAELQPKNPIHCLAHKILYYKYNKTTEEFKKKNQEAEEYKELIFQGRRDIAAAAHKAWKQKQVKRRKPEESDNTADAYFFTSNEAQQLLLNMMEF